MQQFLKQLDWLGIDFNFDTQFQNKIFESQRVEDYKKWLNLLVDQGEAYKCFCKNHAKCESNCENSAENKHNDRNLLENKDVKFVRFKNSDKKYKYYDYMEAKHQEFESKELEDFILYKGFNNQFAECFKKVVDDDIFKVTHMIENKV